MLKKFRSAWNRTSCTFSVFVICIFFFALLKRLCWFRAVDYVDVNFIKNLIRAIFDKIMLLALFFLILTSFTVIVTVVWILLYFWTNKIICSIWKSNRCDSDYNNKCALLYWMHQVTFSSHVKKLYGRREKGIKRLLH